MEFILEILMEIFIGLPVESVRDPKAPLWLKVIGWILVVIIASGLIALGPWLIWLGIRGREVFPVIVGAAVLAFVLWLGVYLIRNRKKDGKHRDKLPVSFRNFKEEDYDRVVDFFLELNKGKQHMNWNWARWEWAYFHPYFDRSIAEKIGLWCKGGKVVGVAAFDMYLGEAFCGCLPGYEKIFPEILNYSEKNLSNENGLGIAINEQNSENIKLLESNGYTRHTRQETILRLSLDRELPYTLPGDLQISTLQMPRDSRNYQLVLWKGFDHGDDMEAFEKSLKEPLKHPNEQTYLKLAVVDKDGAFAAHCQVWYRADTDYAYVEPVCVIPKYRGQGLGRAVVCEALNRCRKLGAKEAYVLSDLAFYRKLGFEKYSEHQFYWKQ